MSASYFAQQTNIMQKRVKNIFYGISQRFCVSINEKTNCKIEQAFSFSQFMKYKVDVPPLSQFTFCIWMKSHNLTYAHPILSYSSEKYYHLILCNIK